jgi:hypothetical protein
MAVIILDIINCALLRIVHLVEITIIMGCVILGIISMTDMDITAKELRIRRIFPAVF